MGKEDLKIAGFTFIELLVVLAIVAIFSMMTIPYGVDFYRARILDEEANSLLLVIEEARSRAVAGEMDSSWGVSFEGSCYSLFNKNENYKDIEHCISEETHIDYGNISEIIFEKKTGRPQVYY